MTRPGRKSSPADGTADRTPRPAPRSARIAALAALGLASPAFAAEPFASEWAASPKSQARLIAADGHLAGFEIKLAPGAITYWRDPGDSGAPPIFDFGGSDNVAKVEVVFPAPKRMAEADGSEAFGYSGGVVFPLRIEPRDPEKPVTLSVSANYAVCEKICLPAQAHLTLSLANSAASPHADHVAEALAAAPRAVEPEALGKLTSHGGEGWRLCVPAQSGPARDLFVEPPAGWWIAASADPEQKDCFKLTLREKPKDGSFPVALRLTLTGGAGPVETKVEAAEPQ